MASFGISRDWNRPPLDDALDPNPLLGNGKSCLRHMQSLGNLNIEFSGSIFRKRINTERENVRSVDSQLFNFWILSRERAAVERSVLCSHWGVAAIRFYWSHDRQLQLVSKRIHAQHRIRVRCARREMEDPPCVCDAFMLLRMQSFDLTAVASHLFRWAGTSVRNEDINNFKLRHHPCRSHFAVCDTFETESARECQAQLLCWRFINDFGTRQ